VTLVCRPERQRSAPDARFPLLVQRRSGPGSVPFPPEWQHAGGGGPDAG
jgi:hypothetical protein